MFFLKLQGHITVQECQFSSEQTVSFFSPKLNKDLLLCRFTIRKNFWVNNIFSVQTVPLASTFLVYQCSINYDKYYIPTCHNGRKNVVLEHPAILGQLRLQQNGWKHKQGGRVVRNACHDWQAECWGAGGKGTYIHCLPNLVYLQKVLRMQIRLDPNYCRLPDPGSILISWILIRPLVHTKEHILVRERTAPPCVFQTFAHPTSPCSAVYSKYLTV